MTMQAIEDVAVTSARQAGVKEVDVQTMDDSPADLHLEVDENGRLTDDFAYAVRDYTLFTSGTPQRPGFRDLDGWEESSLHHMQYKKLVGAKHPPVGEFLKSMLEELQQSDQYKSEHKKRFVFKFRGHPFRVQVMTEQYGKVLHLRRLGAAPTLNELKVLPVWRRLLLNPQLAKQGGMVLIAGPQGQGKTTLLSGILRSIAEKYPAEVRTVEDPQEYIFPRNLPNGSTIIQSVPEQSADFAVLLDDLARGYKTGVDANVMAIGEIKDGASAAAAVRSASNGLLVIATVHANDQFSAVERILSLKMAATGGGGSIESERRILANALRVVTVQDLDESGDEIVPATRENPFPTPMGGQLAYITDIDTPLYKALVAADKKEFTALAREQHEYHKRVSDPDDLPDWAALKSGMAQASKIN